MIIYKHFALGNRLELGPQTYVVCWTRQAGNNHFSGSVRRKDPTDVHISAAVVVYFLK